MPRALGHFSISERAAGGRFLPPKPARFWASYVLVNVAVTIAILAVVARTWNAPFVFPSLGPTAYLFFLNPTDIAASPRNTLLGHALGIACAYGALWVLGLTDHASALSEGMTGPRVACAALALASTGALMVLLDMRQAPAGASTLILSLGILTRPIDLAIIEAAVAPLVVQALLINRLAGIPYPLWTSTDRAGSDGDVHG